MERLQKFLAQAGVSSRRKAEAFILDGRVKVNGKIITELGFKVSENDEVLFDNKKVSVKSKNMYILLNKPEGCVTTADDQFGRKTVLDYVADIRERIYPVGRLDYDTSGLIILTDDGDLTYTLTHPKHNVEKTYIAQVVGKISEEAINNLKRGVIIDNRKTYPAKVKCISADKVKSVIEITISEGRNRQIRKMCQCVGHKVIKLKRTSVGSIKMGNLEKGKYRMLSDEEIKYLKNL